jgi:hypothetical protein
VNDNYPWPPKLIQWEKHQNLQDFLSEVKKSKSVSFFTTPSDFKSMFSTELGKFLKDKSHNSQ